MKKLLPQFLALAAVGSAHAADCISGTAYTSVGDNSCTVPAGVTSMTIVVIGGGGGRGGDGGGGYGGMGGWGARVIVQNYPVTPGSSLPVYVGSGGRDGNGGNSGGGGGGGASSQVGISNPIIAGGGGGGGGGSLGMSRGNTGDSGGNGGAGSGSGDTNGGNGGSFYGGGGSGGNGGTNFSGGGRGGDGSAGADASIVGIGGSGGGGGGYPGGAGGDQVVGSGGFVGGVAGRGGGSTGPNTNGITTSYETANNGGIGGSVLLTFNYTISTTASPAAGGTVSCTPNPVSHGNDTSCTATPAAGYSFTGFSGDCSGTTCSLSNVTATKSVTANFALQTHIAGPAANGTGTVAADVSGGGSTCGFASANFVAASSAPSLPPGVSFPYGLFDFVASACNPGVSVTLSYPHPLPANVVYWKYGPTPSNHAPHWYSIPVSISGNTASFSITDGGLGDDDLTVNGSIVDQGGIGISSAAGSGISTVPTLSEWALLLLAGLVGLSGMRRRGEV